MSFSNNSGDHMSVYQFPINAIHKGGRWSIEWNGVQKPLRSVSTEGLKFLSSVVSDCNGPDGLRDALWDALNDRTDDVKRTISDVRAELNSILMHTQKDSPITNPRFGGLCNEYVEMVFNQATYMCDRNGNVEWHGKIMTTQSETSGVAIEHAGNNELRIWDFDLAAKKADQTLTEYAATIKSSYPSKVIRMPDLGNGNCAIVLYLAGNLKL